MFTKDFISYLLKKPDPYLGVWAFFYSNSNESGVFEIPYNLVLVKFKISRTTLQRIVEYGCEWAENGQKVGRLWADKILKISFEEVVDGQTLGRKWAESGQTNADQEEFVEEPKAKRVVKKPKAKSNNLFSKMVDHYNIFCQAKIGMGAKMDAHQGKSMKRIIEYLTLQVKNKNVERSESEVEDGVYNAWVYILDNWANITGYYAEQIKLNQIDSNLPNILMQLRNNKKTNRDDKFTKTYNSIGQVNFG